MAEEVLALFERLGLKIITWPLIKRKSKLRSKSLSVGSTLASIRNEGSKNASELEKELSREVRMRNDPFFKPIQKNLTQMFKVP